MSHCKETLVLLFAACAFFVAPLLASAGVSGTNAGDVKVKIHVKQGGEWFKAKTMHTDSNGVLELKNAIPGWYKMVIDDDDVEPSQTLAAKIRMLDREGKRVKEKVDVDAYVDIGGTKTFVTTYETDKSGWVELSGITSGTKYYFDIKEKDGVSLSKKDGRPRIKVKAKIDGSDWFRAAYKRTDQAKVLELENVLSGKYKFSYKNGDASLADPFTLKIRVRDEDGKKIRKPTDVDLFAYINKVRVPVGTLKTDSKGWLIIPGVMTKMKYKIEVDD